MRLRLEIFAERPTDLPRSAPVWVAMEDRLAERRCRMSGRRHEGVAWSSGRVSPESTGESIPSGV
jgi:hypothetical protein